MKIRQQHFVQTENAWLERVRDAWAGSITPFNYGLLPVAKGDTALDLRVSVSDSRQIVVQLSACQAVTSGGARIDFRDERTPLRATYQLSSDEPSLFEVIVSVNPFVRVPVGEPDPEEVPVRHPNTLPTYQLLIVPTDQLSVTELGTYHLSVGRVRALGHEVKLSDSYLPPCATVSAHPSLRQWYDTLTDRLVQTAGHARQVVQKIKVKGETQSLTTNLREWAERITYQVAEHLDAYRMVIPHQPPVHLVVFYVRLARVLKTCLLCMSDSGKEEMLRYLHEWSDTHPGTLEAVINTTVELAYNHHDLYASLDTIHTFMDTIASLMAKLAALDYIGKETKESAPPPAPRPSVFVKEDPNQGKRNTFWNI
jgi:hypothetical protein